MSVIVLLADGLRSDVLREAIDGGHLPALAAQRARGALLEVTSCFPSVTGPAYVPFLLGRFPGSVGLPGLRWFDRSRQVCGWPGYSRSYVGHQMNRVNHDLDASAPTVFEIEPRSAAASSMITRGLSRKGQLMSLGFHNALRAIRIHFGARLDEWLQVDRETSDQVVMCARAGRARFIFAAFLGVDKLSHAQGQSVAATIEALRIIDDTVGTLESLRSTQPAPLHIWLASDHGHSPIERHDDLHLLLRDWGLRVLAHPWSLDARADAAVMVSGNAMAHLYFDLEKRTRPFAAARGGRWREMAEKLSERDSVDVAIVPRDDTSCEVWRAGRRARVSRAGGRYSYDAADGDPLGIGASLAGIGECEAYQASIDTDHPDAIVQIMSIAGASRSGDLVLSARRTWDFRERFEPIPHRSSHGALHRDHMCVPLLLDQPPGATPRRTTDVMISALHALGVQTPEVTDGRSFL